MEELRIFALTRQGADGDQAVGYGLVLPNGSAISVSWPPQLGSAIYSTSSAEEAAFLRGTDLRWMDGKS